MSTLKATNIKNESSASNNIVLDSGGGVVVSGILTATTRFDSSGRLLVGTTNIGGASYNSYYSNLIIAGNTFDNTFGRLSIKTKTAAASLSSGSVIGDIFFSENGGGDFAGIAVEADATAGANDFPGRLIFSTTADGASTPTERMRIDRNGHVTIYKDASNLARLQLQGSSTRLEYSDSSGDLTFYTNSSGRVQVGYLGGFRPVTDNSQSLGISGQRWTAVYAVNGTIQTSDLREKTDVATSSLGADFIKQLRPVSYKFKVGENVITKDEDGETDIVTPRPGERTHWGFVAQEVKEVVDAAGVDFGGWILTDKDDPDSTQGLRYDQFIAPLTKALQEAMERIEQLETEMAEVKAQLS